MQPWRYEQKWYAPIPDMILDLFEIPSYVYLASIYNDRWEGKAYVLISALLFLALSIVGYVLFSFNTVWLVFLAWFTIHLYVLMMLSILLGVLCARWWRTL